MFNKEKFLKKIQNIKIKPRWMFIMRFLFLLLGSLISVLIVIFIFSLVIFMMFYGQNNLLKHHELLNWKIAFSILPWAIVGLLIIFLIIFELFVKKLLPLYRFPVLITIGMILLFVGVSGVLVNRNQNFKKMCQCQQGKIKMIEWFMSLYKYNYDRVIKIGIVNKISSNKIEIQIGDKTIFATEDMFCGYCLSTLKEKDEVLVSGEIIKGEFIPFKIKKNTNCQGCNMKNEIKFQGSCNNM